MYGCSDLVGSRQHGVAAKIEQLARRPIVYMVMTSDETQIQILVDWPMSAKLNCGISCRSRDKETADKQKKLSRRKYMAKHVKMSSISDLTRPMAQ